ncbi:MAG: hypothetical protein HY815_28745 [Candidatus Riflebacteria bacterium]|nr:hypothetical protein [Candidatus Riflebacteria bacterium]
MSTEFKVQVEFFGWEDSEERELERIAEKLIENGEVDGTDVEVDSSASTIRRSVISFVSTETGIDWKSFLTKFLEAVRDVVGRTCKGSMTVTEIETSEVYYRSEAAKLSEYEVVITSFHKTRKRVTAKDQADAVSRIKNGEGIVVDESDAPFESSKWSVTACQPEATPAEELGEAA